MRTSVLTTAQATLIAATASIAAFGADHREAPLIRNQLASDIADVYIFDSPTNSNNVVFVMTVNPFSVPSESTTFTFDPDTQYAFQIDSTGDAMSDYAIVVEFENNDFTGMQDFTVRYGNYQMTGIVTPPTLEPDPIAPIITKGPMGSKAFAGPRDDPFFFDVVGFNRFLAGTGGFSGSDGFAGFNVSAIAIECPRNIVSNGSDTLQVWGTTSKRQRTVRRASSGQLQIDVGPFEQIERMGNPAISTALIPSELKDFYNIGLPENDGDDYAGAIVASLESLGTNEENIGILAGIAVPDTLKVDLTMPLEYPNGRGLEDDVVDTLFFFIFNQVETPDGVDANDKMFLNDFPYLADPLQAG